MRTNIPAAKKYVQTRPCRLGKSSVALDKIKDESNSIQNWQDKRGLSVQRTKRAGRRERDPRLIDAYRDPSTVQQMLEYLEISTEDVYFNCVLQPRAKGSRACLKRNKQGEFVYMAFSKKHRKPVLLTLPEVFGNVHHGYSWPDEQLTTSPTTLAFYHSRLAVEAGCIPITRSPLPLLPPHVVAALLSESEAYYASALVNGFGLRLDLGREFVPEAFANARGKVMFARDFRRRWVALAFRTVGNIGRDVLLSDERMDAIWYLLLKRFDVVEQLQIPGRTVYRWGQRPLSASPREVFVDALRQFTQRRG